MKRKTTPFPETHARPAFSSSGTSPSLLRRCLLLCLILVASFAKRADATLVTLGSAYTTAPYYTGVYAYYGWSSCETIFTASEIGGGGSITSFALNKGSGSTTTSVDSVYIFMKETSSTTVSGSASLSGYTMVYKGDLDNSMSSGWATVTFPTSFAYTGTGNLSVMIVRHGGTSMTSTYPNYYISYSSSGSYAMSYNYSSYDYWSGWAGSTASTSHSTYNYYRPQVQLNINAFAACTGTPTAGTAVASTTTACPGVPVKFSLSGSTLATSISYTWDTSSTGSGGWAAAGTSSSLGGSWSFTPPTGRTLYYRCRLTCSAGGSTTTSTSVSVSVSTAYTPPYSETFESTSVGTNAACAAVNGTFESWSSFSGNYWTLLGTYYSGYSADNHTPGGSKYIATGYYVGSYSGNPAGYWFTPGIVLSTGKTYRFSYWYRVADYMATYYPAGCDFGMYYNTSQSTSGLTAIASDISGYSSKTYAQHTGDFTVSSNGTYYMAVKVNNKGYAGYGGGGTIDDIGLIELPDCSTATTATFTTGGKAAASPSMACSTPSNVTLGLSGTPAFSGLSFAWEVATSTPTTFSSASISSMSGTYTISTGGTYYFRCKVTCGATGISKYSDTVKVMTAPLTPPYLETFETAPIPNNVPCASASYTFSSPGYYFATANAGSPGPTVYNHTPGGSKLLLAGTYMGDYGVGAAQWWFSPALALVAGKAYDVNFWYRSANSYSGYDSYDVTLGLGYGSSQSATAMVSLGDTVMKPSGTSASWFNFKRGFVSSTTGTQYIGVKVNHSYYMYYGTNIDDIGVVQLPPCSAKPTAGTATASPGMICSTGSAKLTLLGTSAASDLTFQWQTSSTGLAGSWSNVSTGSGGTTPGYTTPTLTSGPVYYRCVVICGLIAAPNSDTSSVFKMNVGPIALPYLETFESATPGINQPCASYTYSWDAGSGTSYFYYWGIKGSPGVSFPAVTNHTTGGSKYLSAGLYVGTYGLGSPTGSQQYWFTPGLQMTGGMAYKCNYWYVTSGYSYLPGATFGLYYGTSQSASSMIAMRPDIADDNDTYKEIVGTFNAPATGVYYVGVKVDNNYGYYGTAIDDIGVQELPLCAAKPAAGTISAKPSLICSTGTSSLSLVGSTAASKLDFQWLESTTGPTGPFTPVATGSGGTTSNYTTGTLSSTRWYRCVVKCPLIGTPNADTTPVYTMNVGAIIPPYVETFEGSTPGVNVPCAAATNWADYLWFTKSGTVPTYGYTDLVNHTPGGSKWLKAGYYTTLYYGTKDYWFTPAIRLTGGATYEFSYWYLPDGYSGSGVSNAMGAYVGTSQSASAMTALTPDFYPSNSTYQKLEVTYTPSTTGNYYFGIYASGNYAYGQAVDDIGVIQLPPCSGKPTSGGVAAISPAMLCSSGTAKLSLSSLPKVANLSYQWYECTASGVLTTSVSGVLTSPNFTTPTITTSKYYRCIVRCALSATTDTTYSSVVKIDVGAVDPPYIETFESGTPGTNMPCASYSGFGFGSYYMWNVQGSPMTYSYTPLDNHTTGGSKYLIAGYYIGYPSYSGGAAYDYWFTPAIRFTSGKLYQFSYWYQGDGYPSMSYGLAAFMGTTQTPAGMTIGIGTPFTTSASTYTQFKTRFTSTVTGNYYIGIRKGNTAFGYGIAIDDIGLQEVPPCSSTVVAGTIEGKPLHVCATGGTADLDLNGTTLATGLTFEWFSAPTAAGPFVTTSGTSLPYTTDPLFADTWFKCVVKCVASGVSDTTAAYKVGVGAFDMPYTEDFESTPINGVPLCSDATRWSTSPYEYWNVTNSNITGNYKNRTPGGKKYLIGGYYLGSPSSTSEENYWFTPGFKFRAGYKYNLSFYYLASYSTSYKQRMGVYMGKSQSASAMTTVIAPYRVINNTSYSLFDTSFRVTSGGVYYLGFKKSGDNPTTTYSYYGTAYDDINLNYAPCDGTPDGGTISSSVTSGTAKCKGTPMELTDIGATVSLVPGIKYQWQRKGLSSAPPLNWTAITGATDTVLKADTLIGYEYRLAVICSNTNDSAFSPAFQLPALPAHPAVSISPATTPVTFCLGDSVKLNATNFTGAVYDWMLDSVVIPGWKFSDLGAVDPGTYMVRVTSALAPCPGWSNKVKLISNDPGYKVSITLPTDSILCAGTSILLTATPSKSGVTYQWRRDNVNIPGATSPTYLVTIGGTYRVLVSDGISTCAAASRSIVMTVKPNPPAVITVPGGTTTACENEGVLLKANTGGYSYQWMRTGSTVFGWTDSSQLIKNSGTYSVKVRSADGCASTSTGITVNILPSPVPVITKTGIVLGVTAPYPSYQWIREGKDISGATGNTYGMTVKGLYKVRVKDANGCEGESAPIDVQDDVLLSIGNVGTVNDQIRLYPNPTQSKVFIESPIAVKVSVKDVTGKTVYEAQEAKEVDLSKYADGIYLFTISDQSGNELIKQQRVTKLGNK